MVPRIQGCSSSSSTVGLSEGSRTKHLDIKSMHPGDAPSASLGISAGHPWHWAIIKMAAGMFALAGHGGLPVIISATVHPADHTSAL